jgi:hypothetical protein
MSFPICPCDGAKLKAPGNLPALSHIAYRVGTYVDFRRAVLTPLPGEQTLSAHGAPVWRTDGPGDLATMAAEWFAYIADIITFYNERIANQDYLRTADLPESVAHLIAILGYRPRPAIGATGELAALVTAGQSTTLPKGLQFQSKPTPGQAPQIFELSADTPIGPPDRIPAIPPPQLLAIVGTVPIWHFVNRRSVFRTTSLIRRKASGPIRARSCPVRNSETLSTACCCGARSTASIRMRRCCSPRATPRSLHCVRPCRPRPSRQRPRAGSRPSSPSRSPARRLTA